MRTMKSRLLLGATFALAVGGLVSALSLSPAFASGGSAGGGGGGSATLAPAAQISSFSAPTGKYKSWAAIWANFTVKNTGPAEYLTISIKETNTATGNVDWSRSFTTWLANNNSASGTFDNDFAPWETTYSVEFTVTETSTGTVLATASANASTGVQKL